MAIGILHKYAEDTNGNIIHITNAETGNRYSCPNCKEEFIFKNGKIRQKHFSHKNQSADCGGKGEGYLHETFKKLLFHKIIENIRNNTPLEIQWKCNVCGYPHSYNLLLGISEIKMEYSLEACRPDLVLLNQQEKIPFIIEIVDKHEPENNVIEYCKKTNTILIRIKLETIDDLENIEAKVKFPSSVVFFNMLNCPNYRNFVMQNRNISLPSVYRATSRGPTINEIEDKKRRQHYAIQNYYRSKSRKK
jgi:predicted RNA-binding Zn-ribbon protein involved in translation (DUF1610 family)